VIVENRSDKILKTVNILLLFIIVIIEIYPLIFVISASISNPDLVNMGKIILLPREITFEGYLRIFKYEAIWTGYRNTVFYTISGTIINLFMTLTTAFALSRKDFIGRRIIMTMFVVTMFFNGGLIPTFLVVRNLNMVNTIWAMIIPNAVSMWNIIITRTYFQNSVPFELQESAKIDGCSNIRILVSIVLPLSKPIIAVMSLFYGVAHWNAYFNALIYLSNRELIPLQLILREILILQEAATDVLSASSPDEFESMIIWMRLAQTMKYGIIIVSTLPMLIVYPFIQKYFVKGVMIGALKG
jgi:putative aldouronate transport system permease protein